MNGAARRRLAAAGVAAFALLAGPHGAAASPAARGLEVALGRALFEDENLSIDRSTACASCHVAERAFGDARAVSVGAGGREGTRNAPSLLHLGEHRLLMWDGRSLTLEEQVRLPIFNPNELGFSSERDFLARVRENGGHMERFAAIGVAERDLQLQHVARAIASFERSLSSPALALDLFRAGDMRALSSEARAGLSVFRGAAGCADCHLITEQEAPLTDDEFHLSGLGAPRQPGLAALTLELRGASAAERQERVATDARVSALGRFALTLDPKDIGKFRTPSLRNLPQTAPYMHDGSVATIEEAVELELYYRGLAQGYPATLSADERRDLLWFLRTALVPLEERVREGRSE